MITTITAKIDLTTDANQPTITVLMQKQLPDNGELLARFYLDTEGDWVLVRRDELMPEEAKIPLIIDD